MLFLIAVALGGKAPPALSEPMWVETEGLGPRLCVSMVPDAGLFKSKDAAGWTTVRDALAAGKIGSAVLGVQSLKSHPAQRTVKGAAYVLGLGVAIDLSPLIDKYPDDACLRVMAASMALKEGDAVAVSRHLAVAVEKWPDNEDVAAMSVMLGGEDWEERARQALEARPDDARLRFTIAQLAESRGNLEMAVDNYASVYGSGNLEVGGKLSTLALHTGNLGAYLQVVAPTHPVQVEGVSNAEDIGKAYTDWLGIEEGQELRAVIETTKGDLRCTLDHTNAPMTVMNFVGLSRGDVAWTENGKEADRPLYPSTIFHRVIPDFMIQGGDPEGTGRGAPGYRFADEPTPRSAFDRPGLLAMANSGPDTNGSQFFVTEVPTPHLSGKHTIFGACDLDSIRLVERIARVGTNASGRPTDDVVIEAIRFEPVTAQRR